LNTTGVSDTGAKHKWQAGFGWTRNWQPPILPAEQRYQSISMLGHACWLWIFSRDASRL